MSQQTVSRVERGRTNELSIETLGRVLVGLEVELELNVRWRGGELDRVVDEGHAHLVAAIIDRLERSGWISVPEVTYSVGRDRGSIDVLAFAPNECALLVVEVKSDVTTAEGTLRRHDEKVRHAAQIARARLGWQAATVSRLLVLPDASTARRRLERHAALFDRAYPVRGARLRAWLQKPETPIGAVVFVSATQPASDRRDFTSRRRIQRAQRPLAEHAPDQAQAALGARFIDSTIEHSPGE